jgi:hypothetical protein
MGDIDLKQSITGRELKRAIEKAFAILGYSGVDALLSDLEGHGIALNSDKQYQLDEINVIFENLFGPVSNLMINKILREL